MVFCRTCAADWTALRGYSKWFAQDTGGGSTPHAKGAKMNKWLVIYCLLIVWLYESKRPLTWAALLMILLL